MLENQIECYKYQWVLNDIYKAVNNIGSKVSNTERVESRIMNHVGQYLLADKENVKNRRYIRRLIYQEIQFALQRLRREHAEFLSDITKCDKEGQEVEYEPEDVLANVGSARLEVMETITLLAKDDRKRKLILNEWVNGNTNDSDISNTLARVFGGQAGSHRIFVQRFRIECRTQLHAQTI